MTNGLKVFPAGTVVCFSHDYNIYLIYSRPAFVLHARTTAPGLDERWRDAEGRIEIRMLDLDTLKYKRIRSPVDQAVSLAENSLNRSQVGIIHF